MAREGRRTEIDDPATQLVEEIAFRCLEADDVWTAFEREADEHPALRERVRNLLEELRSRGLLAGDGGDHADRIPERLGAFRLLERLGAGGMGIVFLAEQEDLGRQVALKLIRPEQLYFPGSRERFRREVEAVARLQHPGIVPVFTVGEDGGLPYFSMEYVAGCSLAEVLRGLADRRPAELSGADLARVLAERSGLGPRQGETASRRAIFDGPWAEVCLALAIDVAEALEHAHQRGVLHRDVKPSNVLITTDGRARLVDFGLARTEGAQQLTRTTTQLGSLPYLPPEQLDERTRIASVRQDVYSLGVTLYEMLALRSPFLGASGEETRRRIVEGKPASLRERHRGLSWDLETVCLTAMEPDPARRYAEVGALLRDLENVRHSRPIEAKRPSRAIRLRRWGQRHPRTTAASLVGILLLAVGAVMLALFERARSQKARLDAYASLVGSAGALAQIEDDPAGARGFLASCPEEHRHWEWRHLALRAEESLRVLDGHTGPVLYVAWSPDGSMLATSAEDGSVRLWDPGDGRQLGAVEMDNPSDLAFQPGGEQLFVSGGISGVIRIFDVANGAARGELPAISEPPAHVDNLVFSDDGRTLYASDSAGRIAAWDTADRRVDQVVQAHEGGIMHLHLSRDGGLLASGGLDRLARVWSTRSWERLRSLQHDSWVTAVAFGPESRRLFTASLKATRVWDLETGNGAEVGRDPKSGRTISVAPDGSLLAVPWPVSAIRIVRLHADPALATVDCVLHGHEGAIIDLGFDPSGARLASVGTDASIRIWDPRRAAVRTFRAAERAIGEVAFLESGDRVVSGDLAGSLQTTDVRSGETRALEPGHGAEITSIAVGSRGAGFVTASLDGSLRLWDAGTMTVRRSFTSDRGPITAAALDSIRDRVVAGTAAGELVLWSAREDRPIRVRKAHDAYITRVRLDRAGRSLLSSAEDGTLRIWSTDDLELESELPDHPGWISDAVFAGRGRYVASAASDCTVRLWERSTGRLVHAMTGHLRCPSALAASPDGARLVSAGGYDQGLRVWDVDHGRCLLVLRAASPVFAVAFDPAGRQLVTGDMGQSLTLWGSTADAELGERRSTPAALEDRLTPRPSGQASSEHAPSGK